MVEHAVDWQAFQRLDNALVVDFLTSTASALCENGVISPKDTDNLRLVLSGINSASESRERSLLIELTKQHAEFLGVMTARFGALGVCLNLVFRRGILNAYGDEDGAAMHKAYKEFIGTMPLTVRACGERILVVHTTPEARHVAESWADLLRKVPDPADWKS